MAYCVPRVYTRQGADARPPPRAGSAGSAMIAVWPPRRARGPSSSPAPRASRSTGIPIHAWLRARGRSIVEELLSSASWRAALVRGVGALRARRVASRARAGAPRARRTRPARSSRSAWRELRAVSRCPSARRSIALASPRRPRGGRTVAPFLWVRQAPLVSAAPRGRTLRRCRRGRLADSDAFPAAATARRGRGPSSRWASASFHRSAYRLLIVLI
jgi:hypothetical protein